MRHPSIVSFALLAASLLAAVASAGPDATEKPAGFDALRALAGAWEMKADGDRSVVGVTYRVTAAGTAVVETLFPGSEKEMMTVYTMDGEDLVLTHYCAMGNQPRMKATGGGPKAIAFEYVSGGNLRSRDEMHMDSLTMTFADPTHLHHDWTMWKDGKVVRRVALDFTKKAE